MTFRDARLAEPQRTRRQAIGTSAELLSSWPDWTVYTASAAQGTQAHWRRSVATRGWLRAPVSEAVLAGILVLLGLQLQGALADPQFRQPRPRQRQQLITAESL